MKISTTKLHQKIVATLEAAGFENEESAKTADYLVWADASGINTQGTIKLTGGAPIQNVKPTGDFSHDLVRFGYGQNQRRINS